MRTQQQLYQMDEKEFGMLLYLSCQGEARRVLNVLSVDEMAEPGGCNRILRLLDESFGIRSDERFELKQEAYLNFRRSPGQSIAEYISTLKRLRSEYLAEDPDTVISGKSFGQRRLSRASLTRRERYDIFYAAGGAYDPARIEKVMRFRRSNIHTEEKKSSYGERTSNRLPDDKGKAHLKARPSKYQPRRSDRRTRPRASHHAAHVAENDEPNDDDDDYEEEPGDADSEDLEKEALLAARDEDDEDEAHPDYDDEEPDYDRESELEAAGVEDLRDAYAAGWKAKQKASEQRLGRGYRGGGKGQEKGKKRHKTPDQRKASSKCKSCGQIGHWHGDAECPNVKSGKDPPKEKHGTGTYVASASDAAPSSGKGRSGGSSESRVHKVNWTFAVRSSDVTEEWDILHEYDTEESGEFESPSSRPLLLEAAAAREEQTQKRISKYKVQMKTILDALAEEIDDEAIQERLRRKEFRAAQEEQRRQQRPDAKRHDAGRRPMEMELNPTEVMRMLPHMTPHEKKELYRKLKAEVEGEMAQHVPEWDGEKMVRQSQRRGGYHAPQPKARHPSRMMEGASSTARSSSSAAPATPPEAQEKSKVPEAVRKKRLQEFRRKLYENSMDKRGKVQVSEASALPTRLQEACEHPWESLKYGANGQAHWATCAKCHLKKALYYSMEHGALMPAADEEPVWLMEGGESSIILDTGCRTAVAGRLRRNQYQQKLTEMNLPWYEVQHQEVFRFGAGEPVLSTKAFIYPVVLGETNMCSWLRLALVGHTSGDNRVDQCPALVGPSEMRRWDTKMDFGKGVTTLMGQEMATQLSETRHPIIKVMKPGMDRGHWDTKELEVLRLTLMNDPYSLALLQEHVDESDSQGEDEDCTHEQRLEAEEETSTLMELAYWQSTLEDEAIKVADHMDDLQALLRATALEAPEESDGDSNGSISRAESETTHEDGPSLSDEESETTEETDYEEILHADTGTAQQGSAAKNPRCRSEGHPVCGRRGEREEDLQSRERKAQEAGAAEVGGDLHMDVCSHHHGPRRG